MQSYVHTHASCASRSSKLRENSSSRRPKKNFGGPRLRSTDKSPKNPLKFEENFFFESGHQNGSSHIKSCSTHKKGNKIMHEEIIQNQVHEGTQEKFSWKNYDHARKDKQEESYVKKSCMKKPNKIMYVKSMKIKFQDLPIKYTKNFRICKHVLRGHL